MKRIFSCATVFAFLGLVVVASSVRAECYKCKQSSPSDKDNYPCAVCPSGGGPFSGCIPYCDGSCLVTPSSECGEQTLRDFQVAPDGSWSDFSRNWIVGVQMERLESGMVQRNCLGFIGLRFLSADEEHTARRTIETLVL